MCTRAPAYLGRIEVADASSGWVSFSLYLGTIIQEEVVPPGKRTEQSHGSPPLDTFLSSSWLWEGLVLSCQEEPSSHKQQIKPRPVQHRQTVHSFACAQLSAHLLEEAATPAGTRSPTQGCCLKSSPLVAQAHHLCFPAMSLGSGNQVNPVLLPSMLLGSGPSEDSWTHLTDL